MMQNSSLFRGVGVILTLLSLFLGMTGVGRAAGATLALTSSPDTVEVLAQGFQSGEVVTVWLTGPRGQAVATDVYQETDSQGAARFALSLNVANEAGRWTITVYGLDSELTAYAQVDRQATSGSSSDEDGDEDSDEDGDEDSEDGDEDSEGDSEGDSD